MAELDRFSDLVNSQHEIEVEMLDYAFIEKCKDSALLSAILSTLNSGKEGYYPELVKFAEQRLLDILPAKDKTRYLALNREANANEIAEVECEISLWEKSLEETLLINLPKVVSKPLPPVRGYSCERTETLPDDDMVLPVLSAIQNAKLSELRRQLRVVCLSTTQRKAKANLEKLKGNESFRLHEDESAVRCYSRSLAYDCDIAAVWANRAMSYIRLNLFDLAEQDCTRALQLDPSYLKALSRRGLVRFKRGKYAEAAADFRDCLAHDPHNAELLKLLKSSEMKFLEVEGVTLASANASRSYLANDKFVAFSTVDTFMQLSENFLNLHLTGEVEKGVLTEDSGIDFVRIQITFDDESDCDTDTIDDDENNIDNIGNAKQLFNNKLNEVPLKVSSEVLKQRVVELKEIGNELLRTGRHQEALSSYTHSLQIDPFYTPSLGNRAQTNILLKRFEDAEKDCTTILELEPENLKALYRRALAFSEQNQLESAEADLVRLLRLDPHNLQALKLGEKYSLWQSSDNVHRSSEIQKMLDYDGAEVDVVVQKCSQSINLDGISTIHTGGSSDSLCNDSNNHVHKAELQSERVGNNNFVCNVIHEGHVNDTTGLNSKPVKVYNKQKQPVRVVVSLPTEPPKTLYELERVWRSLRDYPQEFALYLSLFKKSTYRRVLKEALSTEIIGSVFDALQKKYIPNIDIRLTILEGFALASNFSFLLSLLSSTDFACLNVSLNQLQSDIDENDGGVAETEVYVNRLVTIRQLYKS